MKQKKAFPTIFQIVVSVNDIEPRIWRRVLVPSDLSLARFHMILQTLMGWADSHLYGFVVGGKRFALNTEDDSDLNGGGSVQTKIGQIFRKDTKKITYEYDFGDEWEVDISVETKVDNRTHMDAPQCTEGARHGPAEDSGGPRGYMEKLRIFQNKDHKRNQQVVDLIGSDYDSEEFNLAEMNEMLREIS